jgi:hypothetical protein
MPGHRRSDVPIRIAEDAFLAARRCRMACSKVLGAAAPETAAHRAARAALDAIDKLADALTGDPRHIRDKRQASCSGAEKA